MATIKIYRAAYLLGDNEDAEIKFSKWVRSEGIDEVLATLPPATPSVGGEGIEIEPTVIGWEEKELDTEPL